MGLITNDTTYPVISSLTDDDEVLVLDGGTGLRKVGAAHVGGAYVVRNGNLAAALAVADDIYLASDCNIGSSTLTVSADKRIRGRGRIYGNVVGAAVLGVNSRVILEGVTVENTDTTVGNIGVAIAASATDVRILRCRFVGSSKTQAVSINATGISGVLVDGCTFDGVNYGVLTNSSATDLKDLRVVNNRMMNIYGDGVELNHPGTAYTAGRDVVIANNHIECTQGVAVNAGFGVGIAGATHVTVANNTFRNCRRRGIHIEDEAKHLTITGNAIAGSTEEGIYIIDGDFINITGNQIYNCAKGIFSDFDGTNWATKLTVSDNVITGCSSHGMVACGSQANLAHIITNNIITNNGGDGLWIQGGGQGVRVVQNNISQNTGYGLRLELTKIGLMLDSNRIVDNTAGPFIITAGGGTATINGREALTSATTDGTGTTPWTTLFGAGVIFKGQMTVRVGTGGGSTPTVRMFDVSYDGTTLTSTTVGSHFVGNIGGGSLRVSGGNLQYQTTKGAEVGVLLTIEARLHGTQIVT